MISRALAFARKGGKLASSAFLEKKPLLAYVGGWLGKNNLGDDALWEAYELLFPAQKLVHFDGGTLSQAALRLPRLGGGLLGGGTLIGQRRSWLRLAERFLESGRPLAIFGTGVEEATFWPGDTTIEDWKPVLARCPFVGVRGPISAKLLADAGVRNVEIVGDPVLTFAQAETNPLAVPNSIGLNLGTSDGRIWGDERRVAQEFTELARAAKQAGWAVHWFVVWPKDLEMTKAVAEASGTAERIHIICTDTTEFLQRVRDLSVFVGMKLHATVLATCALTPSIMVEYRPKCRDYMQSIGQDSATFRTDTFRAPELWDILQGWNDNRANASASLATGLHRASERQRILAGQVASLLMPSHAS